jgi:DMSO/TMAO reductase YedYZ molybdopterin-dependent catalytic subunit
MVDQNPDILIATKMNGVRIPPSHGAPARLVVPGWYAMASVKWVRRITVLTTPFDGYFQAVKYVYRPEAGLPGGVSPVTEVRVKSLLTEPSAGTRLPIGKIARIRGKAWSGSGPVVRVDVDVGSGWVAAALSAGSGPHEWLEWEYAWRPETAGTIGVRVRATDASGASQPIRPFANRFQYGYNAVETVRMIVIER